MTHDNVQPGDHVQVRALRADGSCYRNWSATVERVNEDYVVLFAPAGNEVSDARGNWAQQHHIRSFYWFDRRYNLLEVYRGDGSLEEIYVNIASPMRLDGATLTYTDYELDVSMLPGESPRIVDEEEFIEAAAKYGYPAALQEICRAAAQEALQVAASWPVGGWQGDTMTR